MKPCIYYADDGLRTVNNVFNDYAKENDVRVLDGTHYSFPREGRENWDDNYPFLIFGPITFVAGLKQDFRARDYIFFDEENFRPEAWTAMFGRDFMRHEGEVRRVFDISIEWYGTHEPIYIEPTGYKEPGFHAGLYTRREFEVLASAKNLRQSRNLWVSKAPSGVGDSYQVWVAGDKVISASMIKDGDKLAVNTFADCTHVIEYVKRTVIGKFPEFAYSIVITEQRGWSYRINSFLPIHSTMWYDHELGKKVVTGWMNALIEREKNK